jgi:hypothetical protein
MAESKVLPFRAATDGDDVSGKFTGTAQLSSGKFAVIVKSYEFTLVPCRGDWGEEIWEFRWCFAARMQVDRRSA